MLDVILILSFAMCTLCCVRSLAREASGYAIAGAMFGLLFLLTFWMYRCQGGVLVALERMI